MMQQTLNTTPRPFQLKGVEFAEQCNGRALLAWEMGTGKTFSSYLYAYRNPDVFPIVIVCPATLKWNWEREAVHHFNWRAEVLAGTKPKRTPIPSRSRIVILNYDILHAWIPALLELKPGLVVYDEAHYLSGRTSRRARASLYLADRVPRVLALTGTPMTNRPADLWAVLRAVSPELFPNFNKYGHRYCGPKRNTFSGGWDFSGASNLEELHSKIQVCTSRLRKADVLTELPPQQNTIVLLELTDQKEYEKARDEYLEMVGANTFDRMSAEQRAEAKGSLFRLKHLVAQLKLPAVNDWLEQFHRNSDEKLICFGIHRESVVEQIHAKFRKHAAIITGGVTGRKRQEEFDRFLKDPKCWLLAGNIDAAGVGLSARGVVNTAIAELPWTPSKLDQAVSRTHGIGRGREGEVCQSWYLIARGTIEEKLLRILQRKRQHADQVLDGGVVSDPFELYDELTRMLKKERAKSK